MAEGPKRRATYADIEAAPPHLVAEIIDGELVTHPRPSYRHGGAAHALSVRLGSAFHFGDHGGPGGWFFFPEPGLQLNDNFVVPDLAGWRRERFPANLQSHYTSVPPDWICEILSASTERRDRAIKTRIYAGAGIPYLWIIDPRQQLLEAFSLQEDRWLLEGTWSSADTVRAPPFDAISFSLADLWPLDPPLGLNEDPTPYYAGDR